MAPDPREPDEAPVTDGPGPSKALAGIAAAMPFAFTLSCCVGVPFAFSRGGGPTELIAEMGVSFWFVSFAGIAVPIICGVLLLLAGLGKRVPSVFAIGLAGLPWLVGLAGARYGMFTAEQAIQFAEPEMRAPLLAAGVAEASLAHLYGASLSVGAFVGVALGFALAAIGQGAPDRKLPAVALAFTTLPLLGAAAWLFSIWLLQGPLTPIGVALLTFVVTGMAAVAVGRDAPHHRSGALAVAAVASMILAFIAAASASSTRAMIEVFQAVAAVSSESRAEVIAASAREIAPYRTVSSFGLLFAALPLLAVAGWAASRKAPSVGGLVGGVAVVLCLLLYPLLDSMALNGGADAMARAAAAPWSDLEDFEPVSLEGDSYGDGPRAFLSPSHLLPWDRPDAPISISDRASLPTQIRELLARPGPDTESITGFAEPPYLSGTERYALQDDSSLAVAVDRRTSVETLRAFLASAREAGVQKVPIVGVFGEPMTEAQREDIAAGLPMLAFIAEQLSGVWLHLPNAVENFDPTTALYGVVGASPDGVLLSSPWPDGANDYPLDATSGYGRQTGVVFLALGDGATTASYLLAASRAERAGFSVVAALDGVPAIPPPTANDIVGAIGDGLDGSGVLEMLEQLTGDDPSPEETAAIFDRGIRDAGNGEFLITHEALERAGTQWMRAARIIPDIQDGRAVGLKLYGIRRESLFERLGIQNGDSIRSVNGQPIGSVDSAMAAYGGAQAADQLVVVVDRRGETITRTYRVVERLP